MHTTLQLRRGMSRLYRRSLAVCFSDLFELLRYTRDVVLFFACFCSALLHSQTPIRGCGLLNAFLSCHVPWLRLINLFLSSVRRLLYPKSIV